MASRVNTRFVIILIVGVLGLLGMLMLAWNYAYKSASDLAKRGDTAVANGQYVLAELLYSKAVNKDPTNTENLGKWIMALEHIVPETETEYRDRFYTNYLGAIKNISTILRNDIEAHERFFEIRHEMLNGQYSRELADAIIQDATGSLAFFNEDPSKVSPWERLKRYRGLAIVRIAKDKNSVMDQDKYLLAQDDLTRALAADPNDVESLVGLMNITAIIARQDLSDHDQEGHIKAQQAGLKIAEDYLANNPDNLEVAMQRIFFDADISRKQIDMTMEGQERIAAVRASVESYKDEIQQIGERLLGDQSSQLTIRVLKLFYMLEAAVDPSSQAILSRQMVDSLIAADPENAELLLIAGTLAKNAGNPDEALDWYTKIENLATKPLTYVGFNQYAIKRDALLSRVKIKVERAIMAAEEDDQEALKLALDEAKADRDRFAAEVTDDNLSLMMIDGQIERTRGNVEEALRLFKKFNELTRRENLEGLWQEGITASQLKQYGVARDAFMELIPQDTSNRKILAMLSLAQIYERLQDYELSANIYREVLVINPTLETAQDSLERMEKLINPELNDDPVVAAILTARQLRLGSNDAPGDFHSSVEYLREAVERLEYDPRIARELASILFDKNDVQGAIDVLTKSLEINPDEEWITDTLSAMNASDPVGSRIAMIRQSDGDELNKLLSIARIAFENNREELLAQTVAELNEIDPMDKGVLEMSFVHALRYRNIDDAREIANRPGISQTESLSFLARIAVVEEQPDKAIELLEQAAATGTADASIFQMLAVLQRDNGKITDAIQSFEKSLSISPDNPSAISEYLMTLTRADLFEEALSTARRLQKYGAEDSNFLNLWLNLESIYGGQDGHEFAINQRERILELDPNNFENKGQLARMYIISRRWDESRKLIDDLRATSDNLSLVELDATWYADQGMVNNQNGVALARKVFSEYIEGLEPPVGAEPYITNAEFMLSRGRPDLAVAAANEAVAHQSPETMLGSKLLGDLYMRINNYAKAVDAYQAVLDQGADPDFKVRNRLISTLVTLQRFEEAQRVYDELPENMRTEMISMLQAADIARGMGDLAKARRLLDDTVSRYPSVSYVYVKRAESMIGDESLLNDLLSDIGRALDLQSNDWRAYRVRAAAYFALDRREDALKDLQSALRLNPGLDKSLYAVLNELLSQPGRSGEALDIAREVISRRPDDANLMARIGGLFSSRQEWEKAAEIFGLAWNKRHGVSDGAVYIDCLVRMDPPDAQEANRVINEIAKMVGDINQSAGLLAAQALVLQARGRDDFAQQQITKAFDLSIEKDSDLLNWSGNLSRFFEGQPAEDHVRYLEALKRRNTEPDIQAWLDMFIARRIMSEDEIDPRGYEILKQLMAYDENKNIQLLSYKLYSSSLYAQNRFEEAAEIWRSGIELFSDDWELNNNLAYVLSTKLDKVEEALSYGQTAVDQNPTRSEAYETMAGIYIRLGKYDEAEQMINQGSAFLQSIPSRVSMIITTGRLHLARGNIVEAQSELTGARSILRSSPTAHPSLEADIDAFEEDINSADD